MNLACYEVMKSKAEKRQDYLNDVELGRGYLFKFNEGDRVFYLKIGVTVNCVVVSRYVEDGLARYIVYPPGKRASVGYHVWVSESELFAR